MATLARRQRVTPLAHRERGRASERGAEGHQFSRPSQAPSACSMLSRTPSVFVSTS